MEEHKLLSPCIDYTVLVYLITHAVEGLTTQSFGVLGVEEELIGRPCQMTRYYLIGPSLLVGRPARSVIILIC